MNHSSNYSIITASICSSLVADTLLYSLETLKSIQQSLPLHSHSHSHSHLNQTLNLITSTNPNSHLNLQLKLQKQRSIPSSFTSLYHGVGTAATGSILANIVYFSSYEMIKDRLSTTTAWNCWIAGALADLLCSLTVTVPLDTIKSNMQVYGSKRYRNGLHALQSLVRTNGIGGLYRSLPWTVLRDVPYSAVQFGLYEWMREREGLAGSVCADNGGNVSALHGTDSSCSKGPFVWLFICGAIAGGTASIVTNPADLIKTHMQLYGKLRCDGNGNGKRGGFGWVRGLASGIGWRFVACSLYSGLLLSVYTKIAN